MAWDISLRIKTVSETDYLNHFTVGFINLKPGVWILKSAK